MYRSAVLPVNSSCDTITYFPFAQHAETLILVLKKVQNSQKHAFIFKMGFGMCFHFQNVKGFVSVVLPCSKCIQKSIQSLQMDLLMRL